MNNISYLLTLSFLCLFMLLSISVSQGGVSVIDKNKKYSSVLTGDVRISRFIPAANSSGFYAIAFNEYTSSNYSLFYLEKNQIKKISTLPIPIDSISNPYLFKRSVKMFSLLNNRYLYIGVRHLRGNIYIAIIDTKNSNNVINSFTIESSGFSDVFVEDNGKIRIIGTDKETFVILASREQGIINDQHFVGVASIEGVNNASLMSEGEMLVTSTKMVDGLVKSSLYLLNQVGETQKQTEIDGTIISVHSSHGNTALIMVSLDEEGKENNAIVFNSDLEKVSSFVLPSINILFNPVNQISVLNDSELIMTEVDSEVKQDGNINIVLRGEGRKTASESFYKKGHEEGKVLYDTILHQGKKFYVGVTAMQENEGRIEKEFSIFEIHLK